MIVIQLLLFALPFLLFPFGPSQYELPKVVAAMGLIDVAALYVIFKRKLSFQTFSKPLLIICGLFFLLTIYDLLFLRSSISFFGNQFRFQGILLFWQLLVLAFVSSQLPYKRLQYYWYVVIFLLACLSGFFLGNPSNRSVGTLGEPNAFAAWLVFLWPFVFFASQIPKEYKLYLRVICVVLVILALFLTGSRSGFIAFGIQLLFYSLKKFTKKLSLALIISLIFIFVAYLLPNFQHNLYENRGVIWHSSFVAGLQSPIFGGGFGNSQLLLRHVITTEHNLLIGYNVDSAHNIFLDFWVQGGIIGVGLLIVLLTYTILHFYRSKRWFELLLLLGLLSVFSFNPLSVVSLVQLWWLIGQGFSVRASRYSVK